MTFDCCYGCKERYPGCRCQKYLDKKAELEAQKQAKESDSIYLTASHVRRMDNRAVMRGKYLRGEFR